MAAKDTTLKEIARPESQVVVEEAILAGEGRFLAYEDGRLRVCFEDRTILHVNASRTLCKVHTESYGFISTSTCLNSSDCTSARPPALISPALPIGGAPGWGVIGRCDVPARGHRGLCPSRHGVCSLGLQASRTTLARVGNASSSEGRAG